MRRATQIILVLMGGGVVATSAAGLFSNDCRDSRTPDNAGNTRSCSYGGRNGSWFHFHSGSYSGSTAAAASSVSRGGFGSAGAHASAGS